MILQSSCCRPPIRTLLIFSISLFSFLFCSVLFCSVSFGFVSFSFSFYLYSFFSPHFFFSSSLLSSTQFVRDYFSEFHGAVTYAFDGIFSWQMYGSTEASEDGKPYTVSARMYRHDVTLFVSYMFPVRVISFTFVRSNQLIKNDI